MPAFERFIAIDWSGARAWPSYRHKLQLAVADCGDGPPRLVAPARGWTRQGLLDHLLALLADGVPTLVGFDFSFAPPFDPDHGYLPGSATPQGARAFWAFVDSHCVDPDLGAASFLEQAFRPHFYLGRADGPKAPYMRLRACERAFNAAGGGKPSSVFDAIGAAQVAKGSFSGMRLLHRLGAVHPVWPFDPLEAGRSTVVEIYCRAFIRHAGARGLKLRTLDGLNIALAAFGSQPLPALDGLTDDKTDALVSAAGLRALAGQEALWRPAGLTPAIACTEGWTFAVP